MARKAKEKEPADTPLEEYRLIHEGKVAISRITTQVEIQVRKNGVDADTVKIYSAALEDGMDDLPPVDVFTTAGEFHSKCALLLADGFHRVTSYKQMGRATIPVRVYHGDDTAALLHALSVNGKHGLALTPKDREYDVKILLANPYTKDWTVRKIAEIVGCSKSTVQNVKNPPAPKPAKKREPKEDTPTVAEAKKAGDLSNVGQTPERYLADNHRPSPASEGPAVMPSVVHERQESTLLTKNERLEQLIQWVQEGHITRADVMNIFSNGAGNLVFLKSDLAAGKKTLMVRHGKSVLIEAEVSVNADLAAVIDVSVEDPRMVEFSCEEDPFAVSA